MNRKSLFWSLVLVIISQMLSFGQLRTELTCPPFCGFKTLTFQTNGNQLLDPCGSPVILKGVNKMVYFDNIDPDGARSFAQSAKTGANCVRISWQMRNDNDLSSTSTDRLDRIITNAKTNKLIPIVGLWDYTTTSDGGFSKLSEYVGYWSNPDVVKIIRKHQTHLIINIANEAARSEENGGNETVAADLDTFATAYKNVVRQLRRAGIQVPLMIDGMDRGKSLHCFAEKGPDMVTADSLHNLIFSFHAYWPKSYTDAHPTTIQNAFNEISSLATPLPIVIGELSQYGAWTGSQTVSPCSNAGMVDYQQFAERATNAGIGWMVWEWGPGNQWKVAGDCPQMDMTTDGTAATVGSGANNRWARELATTALYSIKNTAKKTFFINNGFKTCPNNN